MTVQDAYGARDHMRTMYNRYAVFCLTESDGEKYPREYRIAKMFQYWLNIVEEAIERFELQYAENGTSREQLSSVEVARDTNASQASNVTVTLGTPETVHAY